MPAESQFSYSQGSWQSYTPTWSSGGTPPTLGNGSISGRYFYNAPIMYFYIQLNAGSTTTFGTGIYSLSLPSGYPYQQVVHAFAYLNNPSVKEWFGWARAGLSNTDVVLQIQADSTGVFYWTSTVPYTFGTDDQATVEGWYRTQ